MPWPFGKKRSEETKEKISRTKKGRARSHEERQAISEGQKRAWWRRKQKDDEETTER